MNSTDEDGSDTIATWSAKYSDYLLDQGSNISIQIIQLYIFLAVGSLIYLIEFRVYSHHSLSSLWLKNTSIALFKSVTIREDMARGSVVFLCSGIISALTKSQNPRRYWSDLKIKLSEEGIQTGLYDFFVQLKLIAPDGKMRETDCAHTKTILRIIQSIPSPKAEPFKRWLAGVGYERIQRVQVIH